ncbi:MAG: class I SAM-dependent methyltransferase [Phycisphaerales bacterium]|jgi:ubiquinone/menaquinone biosynthesis C-methylase UbiE|nr:class I SAM-dependent methyltransferase [Phycisphaerales bacterium]
MASGDRPLGSLRRKLRARAKRVANPIINRAMRKVLHGSFGLPPPLAHVSRLDGVLSNALTRSEFNPAKLTPVRPFAQSYMLKRPDPGAPRAPDGFALPPREIRVGGYGDTDERYLQIGQNNINMMRRVLARYGRDITPGDNILDFGCSCGPMLRFLRPFAEKGEVWGADIHGDSIAWCLQHMNPPFRFVQNTTLPHLPFHEGTFDLIYCGSVFSHIGAMAEAWLAELARILRPGGTLYATYVPVEAMWKYLEKWPTVGFSKAVRASFTEAQLREPFDAVVVDRSQFAHVVYDRNYFYRLCKQSFDVVGEQENAYTFQSGLVLSRRAVRANARPQALTEAKPANERAAAVSTPT